MERAVDSDDPRRVAAADCARGADDGAGIDPSSPRSEDHADQVRAALDQVESGVDDLLALMPDPRLQLINGSELMEMAQRLERCSNRVPIAGQYLINAMSAANCQTASPLGLFSSMSAFLSALLGISPGEAQHRILIAEAVTPVIELSGHRRPIRHPELAAAQDTGRVGTRDLHEAIKALNGWHDLEPYRDEINQQSLSLAEQQLATAAQSFTGRDLKRIVDRIGEHLNPDGILDDRDAQDAARGFTMRPIRRGTRAGMYKAEGYFTAETGQKATAVFGPLTRPQHIVDQDDKIVEVDTRSKDQRTHDAFDQILDRALRSPDLPAHGGLPASLILFAPAAAASTSDSDADGDPPRHDPPRHDPPSNDEPRNDEPRNDEPRNDEPRNDDVEVRSPSTAGRAGDRATRAGGGSGLAFGWYEDGTRAPIGVVRELTDEAEVTLIATDPLTAEPLRLGRTERIATKALTKALYLRDRGCTFPGCDRTPRWCQRHHLLAWIDGGATDLENLTLVCSFHHHRFAQHGWTAELRDGRVWWRPPKIIDPDRKPLLNTAHHSAPLRV